MAISYIDNVLVDSTSTGTGDLTHSSVVPSFVSPGAGDNGKTFVVMAKTIDANGIPTGQFEMFASVYTHSGTTWGRGALILSSTGSRVSFSGGTVRIAVVNPSEAMRQPEVSISSATSLAVNLTYVCSGTASNYTCTLPSVTGNDGKEVEVRMDSALTKLVTVDAGAGFNIDGASTTLSAAIVSTGATSISVTSATGFPDTAQKAPYFVQIGTEVMMVSAGLGTTTWTVARAQGGTTAQTHLINTPVDWNRSRVMWAGEVAKLRCISTGWTKVTGRSVPMRAMVVGNGQQSGISNGGAVVPMTLTINSLDYPVGQTDATNSRIYIRRTGLYRFLWQGQWINAGSGTVAEAYFTLRRNGAGSIGSGAGLLSGYLINQCTYEPSLLHAGEYVDHIVQQYAGSTKDISSKSLYMIEEGLW